MKNKELLEIIGDIDGELIEDAAPNFEKTSATVRKKRNMGWVKYAAIAACCTLVLSGVMIAEPLFDMINNPDVLESGLDFGTSTDMSEMTTLVENDDGENTFIESDVGVMPPFEEITQGELIIVPDLNKPGANDPAVNMTNDACTEVIEPDEDYTEEECYDSNYEPSNYLIIKHMDERYKDYSLTQRICDETNVGEKITSIKIDYYWSHMPSDVHILTADIFEVIGIDGEFSLCYKYVDTNGLRDESNYYFLNKHNYSFGSLENMYEKLNMHEYANITDSVYFSQSGKSYDTYCHNFKLYGEAEKQFLEMLLSVKGVGLGSDMGLRNTVQFSANKKIEFWIEISNSDKHNFYVLDNGYILCIAYGSSVFEIGEENAKALIEFIEKYADPQGYEWDEKESIWVEDVVETDDVGNAVSDFASVFESIGDVKLDKTVRYRETVIGFAPSHFTLDADLLEAIGEMLYICNGVPVYDMNIDGEADECVVFANVGENTVGFAVYSNGYIGVNGIYYEVGTEPAQKIINIVKTEGKAPDNMFWNDKEECWQTYGPDEGERIEPDETSPAESVDHGYGSDSYDVEKVEVE